MLADELDYVVGVDTHRDAHALAVVDVRTGAVVAEQTTPANGRGYESALRLVERHAAARRVWAIEGAGHYGAGLARFLGERGEAVLEVGRTPRRERRLQGKDDRLDAVRAARSALASEPLPLPRAGERREALRLLLVARRSAVDVRRQGLVQLRSVIVTAPDRLRSELRGLPTGRLLDRCSRLRRTNGSPDEIATRLVLRSLARRAQAATSEADQLEREILAHVRELAPALLDEPGIGPIVARPTARRLVAPRPAPLRGRLRPPRRRCAGASLERPDHPSPAQPRRRPATQPRTPHDRPPPPPPRPSDQGLHRPPDRRGQDAPRGHPAAQALPRSTPLPAAPKPGAASGLTGHRSFTAEHSGSRAR